MSTPSIEVGLSGLHAPLLESGLSEAALADMHDEILTSHRELMARRGKDLGFYDLPLDEGIVKSIESEVRRLRSFADDLVVLGIGGSSLGGQALIGALAPWSSRGHGVHFVDNVDPATMAGLLAELNAETTAVVVITKSGGTVETLAQLLIVRRWLKESLGQGEARNRMVFVTDPERGILRELAKSEGVRAFEIPANVGGRFSVLSAVGLLPAAFAGVDIKGLLAGAAAMVERVTDDDVTRNPACQLAAGAVLAQRKLEKSQFVMMPYSDALRVTTSWFVQLWAESLGKRVNRHGEVVHAGQTPVAAVGATDQHAQVQLFVEGPRDKVVTVIEVASHAQKLEIPDELAGVEEVSFLHGRDLSELLDAERRATRAALLDAGVPVLDIRLSELSPETVGGLLVLLEAACANAGLLLVINPFDQPGVETGKKMALGLLGREGFSEYAERVEAREAIAVDSVGARA
ncbi:MAG: glucose-6-phosphate isomerase [Myxococcota bacterium]|nr:glucose-6-phosphate isomerase [Myxococcota bacterium]